MIKLYNRNKTVHTRLEQVDAALLYIEVCKFKLLAVIKNNGIVQSNNIKRSLEVVK